MSSDTALPVMCVNGHSQGENKSCTPWIAPLIDTPFRRVAIDIIGPISPASRGGNRYILTMVDYATRYPEGIDTEQVAEALVEMFSRVGVPVTKSLVTATRHGRMLCRGRTETETVNVMN